MRLLKRIFGWNTGQTALIFNEPSAPQFKNEEAEPEEDHCSEASDTEEEQRVIEKVPTKIEVKGN